MFCFRPDNKGVHPMNGVRATGLPNQQRSKAAGPAKPPGPIASFFRRTVHGSNLTCGVRCCCCGGGVCVAAGGGAVCCGTGGACCFFPGRNHFLAADTDDDGAFLSFMVVRG